MIQRALLTLALCAAPAAAQFSYELSLDTEAKLWSVTGRFANPGGADVDYWIARWTPGAYHVADYGRLVEGLEATDGAGRELSVERVSASQFVIAAEGAEEVVVRYRARSLSEGLVTHGAVLDVESNRITRDYAYVTPVSLFGFVPDRDDEPFFLEVDLPQGWKAATALRQGEDGRYRAESFARFEDSPLFFSGTHTTYEREVAGKPLAVTIYGKTGAEAEAVVEDCVKISAAAAELMGGVPYDRYHYLIGYVPEGAGSGLEHSFSTLILLPERMPAQFAHGLIAHEFFHLWCAERVHVQEIREPDFTEPFQTGTIWVNEPMTEYMTQHVLLQAGLLDRAGFFRAVGPSQQLASIAAQLPSLVETSRNARDWGSMNDLQAFSVKMYQHGPRVILALDLEMRRSSGGERGVVDFLRHVMAEYDATGRGFEEDGVLDILNQVADGDLSDVYESFVLGNEGPDLAQHLDVIGHTVQRGRIVPVEEPTAAQQAALADFFAPDVDPED